MLCYVKILTYLLTYLLTLQIIIFYYYLIDVVSDMPVCAVLWEWRVQAGPVEVGELYNPPMI